uniref:uncharacterized protein LOC109973195 n=1 Tax=Monopterus albus TaxID=43700 RepID=UPI0009B4B75B|nr:uncharacterized protein LOC109973195 [Monopterus albus]
MLFTESTCSVGCASFLASEGKKKKMACGVCVKLLLLLTCGQFAHAFISKKAGSSGIKPSSKLAEEFPTSYVSASLYLSAVGSAQPGVAPGSSGPSYSQSGSSGNLRPAAAPSAGGDSGLYGRPVEGYVAERLLPGYKSDPVIRSRHRASSQWGSPVPQKENRFIVSSYAIEMRSESRPQQPARQPRPMSELLGLSEPEQLSKSKKVFAASQTDSNPEMNEPGTSKLVVPPSGIINWYLCRPGFNFKSPKCFPILSWKPSGKPS